MKIKQKKLLKILSIGMTVLFLHQQISWAQGITPTDKKNINANYSQGDVIDSIKSRYSLLEQFGNVEHVFENKDGKTIIAIQDAHASLSAQYSIVDMLDTIMTQYKVDVVALEGTEGPIDVSLLRSFPDKATRRKTAEYLMSEGLMSAGEFFSIVSDKPVKLYGVEDHELYKNNIKLMEEIAEKQSISLNSIETISGYLKCLTFDVFNEDLRLLYEASVRHREGDLPFSGYWEVMEEFVDEHNVSISRSENLSRFIDTMKLEETISFKEVNRQRKEIADILIEKLSKEGLERFILDGFAFKTGKMSAGIFHQKMLNLGDRIGLEREGIKHFVKYVEYVCLYESIAIDKLYIELRET